MTAPSHPLRTAVIVAVGSELLTPYKIDTNSLYLTERLNAEGVSVRHKVVVGDDQARLAAVVRHAIPMTDLIVLTGGLGATDDDLTRDAVASVFGLDLEENDDLLSHIRSRFASRGLAMPEVNRRQAQVPRGAVVLWNPRGTAPGLLLEREEVTCLLLPGPPRELKPMFEQVCADRLGARMSGRRIARRTLIIAGRTESHVEELTQPIYTQWLREEPPVQTTILASLGQIELHLWVEEGESAAASDALDRATRQLADVLGPSLVSTDGTSLEGTVGRLLASSGRRVAVAESCTGGLLASRLTDVSGSSAYVEAGWVTYSNDAKVAFLGVDRGLIESQGAVSEAVAEAMASGARRLANVDYGIGVTGIAGPSGGSDEKPVGTVCIALASADQPVTVRRFRFPGERDRVKFQASQTALDMLRRALIHGSSGWDANSAGVRRH